MSIWTAANRRPGQPRARPARNARREIPLAVTECPFCGSGPVEREGCGADRQLHHVRDRPAEAVELRMGRPLRRRRGADGQRLQRLGRHLLPRGPLARRWRRQGPGARLLGVGERAVCLAQADDWLNTHETDESAFKSKGWLKQAATEKQLRYLPPAFRSDYGLTRYRASALITFGFNKRDIRQLVGRAAPGPGGRREPCRAIPSPPAPAADRPGVVGSGIRARCSAPSAHPAPAASAGSIPTGRVRTATAAGSAPWAAKRPSPAKRKED